MLVDHRAVAARPASSIQLESASVCRNSQSGIVAPASNYCALGFAGGGALEVPFFFFVFFFGAASAREAPGLSVGPQQPRPISTTVAGAAMLAASPTI